jgi:hypothetical protein
MRLDGSVTRSSDGAKMESPATESPAMVEPPAG